MLPLYHSPLLRNEKRTGAEMCPAMVSGIINGDAPVRAGQLLASFFPLVPK